MKYLEVDGVGRTSRIGLGTWQFGSREWGYGDQYASGPAREIVQRALALGVTLFDTAEIYGTGKSERIQKILDTFGIDNAAQDHVFFEKFLAEQGPVWIELVKGLNLEPQ